MDSNYICRADHGTPHLGRAGRLGRERRRKEEGTINQVFTFNLDWKNFYFLLPSCSGLQCKIVVLHNEEKAYDYILYPFLAYPILVPAKSLPHLVATHSCHTEISCDTSELVPGSLRLPLVSTSLAKWRPESTKTQPWRIALMEERKGCQKNCSGVGHWHRHTELLA